MNQYCNNAILSILGEEQLSDVNLSTFYVFDKESAKSQMRDLCFIVADWMASVLAQLLGLYQLPRPD